MKILIITSRLPYPPYRGDKLKIYNIAKNLAKKHKIIIAALHRNDNHAEEAIKHYAELGIELKLVNLGITQTIKGLTKSLLTNKPFQVGLYNSNSFTRLLKEIVKKENIDLCYFHLIRTAQYLDKLSFHKCIKVIDFTDAVSLYLTRFLSIEKNIFKKYALLVERNRIVKYEKQAEKFDALFICSETDKEFLLKKDIKIDIRLLLNGLDTEYFKFNNQGFDSNRIIFTGNMPYFPNYDAVLYFVHNIFPLIIKRKPDVKFYIVGQNPPKVITDLNSENIIVTGFVKDIKQEYLLSAVNVAPMRFGAGTLNKIIESIILGVPVVSSSMSVMGMPEEIKEYVLTADSPNDFAEKVLYVMDNPSYREKIIDEGIPTIKKVLDWKVVVDRFLEDIEEIRKIKTNTTD